MSRRSDSGLRPVLGIVPARGGSKEIPGKNLKLLGGRPLLAYAIGPGLESGVIDRLILSTDSDDIARVGAELGAEVPFVRPSGLARDDTPMQLVLEHAVAFVEAEGHAVSTVVVLQPTAPLRRAEHIVSALEVLESTEADSVASVVEVPHHYSPEYVMKLIDGRLEHFLPTGARLGRRQDAAVAYSRDGTVYAVRRDVLMCEHSLYGRDCRPLTLERAESVNLDTLEDWAEAERRLGGGWRA